MGAVPLMGKREVSESAQSRLVTRMAPSPQGSKGLCGDSICIRLLF